MPTYVVQCLRWQPVWVDVVADSEAEAIEKGRHIIEETWDYQTSSDWNYEDYSVEPQKPSTWVIRGST